MSDFDIPEDVVILTGADEPIIRQGVRIIDVPPSPPPDKTTSLRWNDKAEVTHIIRLDQVVQIDVVAVGGDDGGYHLNARFIGGSGAILNYANPEQDQQQAIATAIQIIKLASDT